MKKTIKVVAILGLVMGLLVSCNEPSKGNRIQWFLSQGVIPIIDMQSTLTEARMNEDFPDTTATMNDLGIAQFAFEGTQAPQQDPPVSGYRWSDYINKLVWRYPNHLFLTANGGNNRNWAQQKDDESSYISQLEQNIRSGDYALMGELEFRHYMSSAQCREGKTHRNVTVPIESPNGHRVFRLSQETGVPFVIHYEPEIALIAPLESMLDAYPGAKVIWAHFGQLRKPARMTDFSPALVKRLLRRHKNLYFDLATGKPNRRYYCVDGTHDPDNGILDTVIWQDDGVGGQTDTLKPEYRRLIEGFSTRFVSAMDYGGNRSPFDQFFTARTANLRLIMRDLSPRAQHNISYRNAWFLLTGKRWHKGYLPHPGAADLYFIDAHSQADSHEVLDRVIPLMDQAGVKRTILAGRRGLNNAAIADFAEQHPDRIIPSIRTKGRAYIDKLPEYFVKLANAVASGRFAAIAELLMYHAQKGDRAEEVVVYPDDDRVLRSLDHAIDQGWPLVVHIEFASLQGEQRQVFMQKLESLLVNNPDHPFVMIHMGQLNVGEVRRLIRRHDNIYFMMSHANPVVIENSSQPWTNMFRGDVLAPAWNILIRQHPGRFILAFDNVWPEHWGDFYLEEAGYWRTALSVLPDRVARSLAHNNAERLWGLPTE